MIKFTDHSVILNPLSSTTEQSFDKMGSVQTTIFNARMMQLVEMADIPEVKTNMGKDHRVRAALYSQAEAAFNAGSLMLRRNNRTDRFEGAVILDHIDIKDATDHQPTLFIPELGHFTVDNTIKNDTVSLLKKIGAAQLKSVTNIKAKDDQSVSSDHRVRFELARTTFKQAFMLRIYNL